MAEFWPQAAASMAVFRNDKVLIALRGKGALAGLWSLPGGHIEPGETARAAARREVLEETLIEADILGLVDLHDVIQHNDDGSVRVHYVISIFCGVWTNGEPKAGDDCRQAKFVALDELCNYPLTEGAAGFIAAARHHCDKAVNV